MRGMSLFRPRTELGLIGGFIAVPIVALFVWAFNSYQLGKFGNKKKFSADNKTYLVVIVVFIFITASVIALYLLNKQKGGFSASFFIYCFSGEKHIYNYFVLIISQNTADSDMLTEYDISKSKL